MRNVISPPFCDAAAEEGEDLEAKADDAPLLGQQKVDKAAEYEDDGGGNEKKKKGTGKRPARNKT